MCFLQFHYLSWGLWSGNGPRAARKWGPCIPDQICMGVCVCVLSCVCRIMGPTVDPSLAVHEHTHTHTQHAGCQAVTHTSQCRSFALSFRLTHGPHRHTQTHTDTYRPTHTNKQPHSHAVVITCEKTSHPSKAGSFAPMLVTSPQRR